MSRFSKLSRDKLVVNCRTPDEARRFVQLAHDKGYHWERANRSETFFGDWGMDMCYRIRTNTKKTPNIILYNSISFYRRKGYNVISFYDFLQLGQPIELKSTSDPVGVSNFKFEPIESDKAFKEVPQPKELPVMNDADRPSITIIRKKEPLII